MSCWLSESTIETESTRNGMSSVTTSTTVCPPADHPFTETLGVNTLTAALPCGRSVASLSSAITAPYRSDGLALEEVLGATWR